MVKRSARRNSSVVGEIAVGAIESSSLNGKYAEVIAWIKSPLVLFVSLEYNHLKFPVQISVF